MCGQFFLLPGYRDDFQTQVMEMLRPSEWTYNTSTMINLGFEVLVASGGNIVFNDPSGEAQNFYYGGFGLGLSRMIRIPHVPDLKIPRSVIPKGLGASGAASTFSGGGAIYMTSAFHGKELARSDLSGSTMCFNLSGGFVFDGGSATVMLLGINTALLEMGMVFPQFPYLKVAIESAPAALTMFGFNVGSQPGALEGQSVRAGIGFGADVMIGHLH